MKLNYSENGLFSNNSKTTLRNFTSSDNAIDDPLESFRLPLSLMASGVVVGNSLVCALFCSFRKLRTITNTFVASLAISDCLVAVVFVPCFLLQGYIEHIELIVPYIIGYILFAYLFNFCGVTYDRFQAIVKPLSYNAKMTRVVVNRILCFVWIVPFLMTLIPATWENQPAKTKSLARRINQGFLIFLVTALALVIFVAYCKIFQETRRQVKWMVSTLAASAGNTLQWTTGPVIEGNVLLKTAKGLNKINKKKNFSKNIATEVKAAKVFAVLIATFSVCWLPLIIINIVEALGFAASVPSKLKEVSLFTLVGNSLIDPFIYSLYKPDFRKALRRFFGCLESRKDGDVTSNCSYSNGKESFRVPKNISITVNKLKAVRQPLNEALSDETVV